MTLTELMGLGRRLTGFLAEFRQCFASVAGRRLLRVYVQGQLSDVPRKNCEAIALRMNQAPRTLQRFLESIKWDESQLRDRCQEIVARDHAHPEAIGLIDESGTVKSGDCTAGAARQYNGNRGKIENCIVGVHLGYSTPGFQTLLDSRLYLPKDWAEDAERRKKTPSRTMSCFRRSRRLPSTWWTEPSAMACAWPTGRAMNCMGATERSWMPWTLGTKRLWPKSPATCESGRSSPWSFTTRHAVVRVVQNRHRTSPQDPPAARSATCGSTRLNSTSRLGNAI